jgi:hypothetical protein
MTSFETSSDITDKSCPDCQGPMTWRREFPYPVVSHLIFGASFLAFLLLYDQIRAHRLWLWLWSVVQIALGAWVMRARLRARKRVLRCIRCSGDLG